MIQNKRAKILFFIVLRILINARLICVVSLISSDVRLKVHGVLMTSWLYVIRFCI